MVRLFEYVVPVRKMTRGEFVAAHPHPFLVAAVASDVRRQDWTFKTQTLGNIPAKLATLVAEEELTLLPGLADFEVIPIVKALNNPWQGHVSVGRARNNDIVLTDISVSKLHAQLRRGAAQTCYVKDAGSRNGTRVNDVRLDAHLEVEVRVGDKITFGRADATFVDANSLYDLVSKYVQAPEKPVE
ncbi:MAG: FHA domain-containing protein [Deltaproteobacteria bacterium]|nr:FHA domain-containing protein [Deltaproteobacteria bacterium]